MTSQSDLVPEVVAELVAAIFPSSPLVNVVPLRGGLEAAVARLTIHDADRRRRDIIVKRLTEGARREAARYQLLASSNVTPSFLGAVDHDDSTYLFLERVRPASNWPWRDSTKTRMVLEQLARVHRLDAETVHADGWDYEHELRSSAAETLEVANDVAASIPELDARRQLRALGRVVAALPEARQRMMAALGRTLIHGDVHTGNVMLRGETNNEHVVLLDWGRSRAGSPLEDVSSWLLSLRSWEPAAARDHDTLFRAYLRAAGLPMTLTPELRDAYWYAAASNALAGALRYQLVVARDSTGRKRATARSQARAALRVIRRADERLVRAGGVLRRNGS